MTDKLKPVAYMVFQEGLGDRVRYSESLIDQWYSIENAQEYYGDGMIPLYAIPEGYSLVPDEPTEPMLEAADFGVVNAYSQEDIYNAMLKAAKEDV